MSKSGAELAHELGNVESVLERKISSLSTAYSQSIRNPYATIRLGGGITDARHRKKATTESLGMVLPPPPPSLNELGEPANDIVPDVAAADFRQTLGPADVARFKHGDCTIGVVRCLKLRAMRYERKLEQKRKAELASKKKAWRAMLMKMPPKSRAALMVKLNAEAFGSKSPTTLSPETWTEKEMDNVHRMEAALSSGEMADSHVNPHDVVQDADARASSKARLSLLAPLTTKKPLGMDDGVETSAPIELAPDLADLVYDTYTNAWKKWSDDFDKLYGFTKYSQKLDKADKDAAKKIGEKYDKAVKKLLDKVKDKNKDDMKGDKVESPGDARLKEYEAEAKQIEAHRQYYGDKGYATPPRVIAAPKGKYTPEAYKAPPRPLFS